MPRISVGLPTFNRPVMLARALRHIQAQSFEDFELVVSNNASPDLAVEAVVRDAMRHDSRIRYIKHETNVGPARNFWHVFDQSSAPLFVWISDDDIWSPLILQRAVDALDRDPRASSWFCQIENINLDDQTYRTYPTFTRFASGRSRSADLFRFLWEPEIMGKANLFHSITRRAVLKTVVDLYRHQDMFWGMDMTFVYALQCRGRQLIDDSVVVQKRVDTHDKSWTPEDPRLHIYPWSEARSYFRGYLHAASQTKYEALTCATLAARWAFDTHYHRLRKRPTFWFPPGEADPRV